MKESSGSWTAPSWFSFFRDTKWGRTAFLLALAVLASWIDEAVFAARDAIVGAGETAATRADSLRNSFNVDGLANLGGRMASSISRDWWEIFASLLTLGLCVAAIRFLDGVRPRSALAELGLRGGLPRGWRRLALVPFLPPLVWLGYTMWTTEPRLLTDPWTWKSYFLPFADQEGSVFGLIFKGYSSRPVWGLNAVVSVLAGYLLTYGLVWRQLRRLGFRFAVVVGFLLLPWLVALVVELLRYGWGSVVPDSPGGAFLPVTGLLAGALVLALSGWILERWECRAWVPALAMFSTQVPYLLAFPYYSVGSFQVPDDNLWLPWAASLFFGLGPLLLLALLTALAPRFGLPSLPRRNEACGSPSPS